MSQNGTAKASEQTLDKILWQNLGPRSAVQAVRGAVEYTRGRTSTQGKETKEKGEEAKIQNCRDAQAALLATLSDLKGGAHKLLSPEILQKWFLSRDTLPEDGISVESFEAVKNDDNKDSAEGNREEEAKKEENEKDEAASERGLWIKGLQQVWGLVFALTAVHCAKLLPKPNLTSELLKQLEVRFPHVCSFS
jgi:hypothetical protein